MALGLSVKKSEIKKISDDIYWNMWTNLKKMYAWNNIFQKRIPNVRFWIIYILVQISRFFGTALVGDFFYQNDLHLFTDNVTNTIIKKFKQDNIYFLQNYSFDPRTSEGLLNT